MVLGARRSRGIAADSLRPPAALPARWHPCKRPACRTPSCARRHSTSPHMPTAHDSKLLTACFLTLAAVQPEQPAAGAQLLEDRHHHGHRPWHRHLPGGVLLCGKLGFECLIACQRCQCITALWALSRHRHLPDGLPLRDSLGVLKVHPVCLIAAMYIAMLLCRMHLWHAAA